MTVLVRPVPRRVAGNRIIPFRQVKYTYTPNPNALRDWKPPVPEPLPPAPLLGLGTLAALGLQALAWWWGQLNSRQGSKGPAPGNTTTPQTELRYEPGVARSYIGSNYGKRADALGGGYQTLTWYSGTATPGNSGAPYTDREPEFYWRSPEVNHPAGLGTENFPAVRWYDPRDGVTKVSYLVAAYFIGEQKITVKPSSGNPASWMAFPDGSTIREGSRELLEPDPKPAPIPPVPLPLPIPTTSPQPEGDPVTEPQREPEQPKPGTITSPELPPPTKPPAVIPGSVSIANGALVPVPKPPVPVTPADVVFPVPGGKPIGGGGVSVRPDLVGIAQEVGKLEQKLEAIMSPDADTLGEKWRLLWEFLRAMYETSQGGTYTLREPCDPDGDGQFAQRTQDWVGGFTAVGTVGNKVDALARLLQDHKDLMQPTCPQIRPQLSGEWVTVNFKSVEPSPGGKNLLRKVFRYRDQNAHPLATHIDHWEGFEWNAGPVIVVSKNLSWGTPKVWASTADEGKRVIAHAAQVAGVDLSDKKHQWIVTYSNDPRYGQPALMRRDDRNGRFVRTTKRDGPSGLPYGAVPDS